MWEMTNNISNGKMEPFTLVQETGKDWLLVGKKKRARWWSGAGFPAVAPHKAGLGLSKGTGSRDSLRGAGGLRTEGRQTAVMKKSSQWGEWEVHSRRHKDTTGWGTDGQEVGGACSCSYSQELWMLIQVQKSFYDAACAIECFRMIVWVDLNMGFTSLLVTFPSLWWSSVTEAIL